MTEKRETLLGCCATIEQYNTVAEAGFDYIELPGRTLAAISEDVFHHWKQTVHGGALPCLGLNAALPAEIKICGPQFSETKIAEYARLLCRRAAALGVGKIGIGSPASRELPQDFPIETAWQQTAHFLKLFCAEALPWKIWILWEPLNPEETGFGVDSIESAAHIANLQREGISNIGLVADLYHMARKEEDFRILEQISPFVRHVHIASPRADRGFVTEEDAAVLKPLVRTCALCLENISAEIFSGQIRVEGAASLKLLRRWLQEGQATGSYS